MFLLTTFLSSLFMFRCEIFNSLQFSEQMFLVRNAPDSEASLMRREAVMWNQNRSQSKFRWQADKKK